MFSGILHFTRIEGARPPLDSEWVTDTPKDFGKKNMGATVYDLHSLGWQSFQQLCLTVTREILGQTVESFLDSNDGGRDGAFGGAWVPGNAETLRGRFVIQCKFTVKKDSNLHLSDLADELGKAKRLVAQGRCDNYVLLTNAGLSGMEAERIEGAYKAVGVKNVLLYGSTWICQQIQESKRLRMLVPRVYGLGDLSQILDERAYAQARALLASLRDDLSKVVVTSAYKRAAAAIDRHGFVLLIGEPAPEKRRSRPCWRWRHSTNGMPRRSSWTNPKK
ncbi:MAG: hypothetical protein ACREQ4_04320 [Candidatus Binataceae bacterium]